MKKTLLTFLMFFPLIQGFSQVIDVSIGAVTRFSCPNFLDMTYDELKANGFFMMSQYSTSGSEQTVYTININDSTLVRKWTEKNGVRIAKTHKILEVIELDLEKEWFWVHVEWNETDANVFTNGCTRNGEDGTCVVVIINPTVYTGYEAWDDIRWIPKIYNIGFAGLMKDFEVKN